MTLYIGRRIIIPLIGPRSKFINTLFIIFVPLSRTKIWNWRRYRGSASWVKDRSFASTCQRNHSLFTFNLLLPQIVKFLKLNVKLYLMTEIFSRALNCLNPSSPPPPCTRETSLKSGDNWRCGFRKVESQGWARCLDSLEAGKVTLCVYYLCYWPLFFFHFLSFVL